MNKIVVNKDDTLELNNNAFNIEINCSNLTLNISGKVLINEFVKKEKDNTNIIINLANNSELLYNRFLNINNMDTSIIINQDFNENDIVSRNNLIIDTFMNYLSSENLFN